MAEKVAKLGVKRKELLNEIDTTCKNIELLVKEFKEKRYKQINDLFDDYKDFTITNGEYNTYSKNDIEKVLDIIINNMSIKYIEGTIYDVNVGILNKDIVIWQIA